MTESQTPAEGTTKGTAEHPDLQRQPRSMAVFADSRASDLLVRQTVATLIGSKGLEHAFVDLITPVGIASAQALQEAGIAYTVMSMGVDIDPADEEVARLLSQAASVAEVDPAAAATLQASLMVVPAAVGSLEEYLDNAVERTELDFSLTTLPGVVLESAQAAGRDILMIDTPERGLIRTATGEYRRRVFHVGHAPSTELAQESPGEES